MVERKRAVAEEVVERGLIIQLINLKGSPIGNPIVVLETKIEKIEEYPQPIKSFKGVEVEVEGDNRRIMWGKERHLSMNWKVEIFGRIDHSELVFERPLEK